MLLESPGAFRLPATCFHHALPLWSRAAQQRDAPTSSRQVGWRSVLGGRCVSGPRGIGTRRQGSRVKKARSGVKKERLGVRKKCSGVRKKGSGGLKKEVGGVKKKRSEGLKTIVLKGVKKRVGGLKKSGGLKKRGWGVKKKGSPSTYVMPQPNGGSRGSPTPDAEKPTLSHSPDG